MENVRSNAVSGNRYTYMSNGPGMSVGFGITCMQTQGQHVQFTHDTRSYWHKKHDFLYLNKAQENTE